jgi:membrane-associated phospholipid phosphatase
MTSPPMVNPESPVASAMPASVRRARRRRRPSGAPAPLPRSLGTTGRGWLVAAVVLLVWVVVMELVPGAQRATDRADAAILRWFAQRREHWLTEAATEIDQIGSGWSVTVIAIALLIGLLVFRRWRHLFTFVVCVAVIEIGAGDIMYHGVQRPRPYDVTIVGRWAGFSLPSPPVAVLMILGIGITYTMVVAGHRRLIAKTITTAVVVVFATARVYLGVDHPFDVVLSIVLVVGLMVNAFRFFTPNESFPVSYRKGKTAHLDIGGRRGDAIRAAVFEQLGLTVVDLRHVGLEGSGGSTPLRLRVAGDPDRYLFGKLYAMSHVRADRWYKLGRTILYGRLEDEAPFQSVRRLVEYEDYAARVLRDAGIPTASTFGIVELTPEREYLLVTEFFDGAQEIGAADVDDAIIDEALTIVRRLWDAGLAHRDIKPANVLVADGRVKLIDVFFVQIRPSPWRQAIDLANMMLVLAVRTDAPRVYSRARLLFTEDEIAEAFAAARGIASPTQLRMMMKRDPRDLLAEFRALAPARRPITLQQWSIKRVVLALAVLALVVLAGVATTSMFRPAHDIGLYANPECESSNVMILFAQSVPSATAVPCVASLPAGWSVGGLHAGEDGASIRLDSEIGGEDAVVATLRPRGECSVDGAVPVASDEVGIERYERPEQLPPDLRATRTYLFDGGCVTYRFSFSGPATATLTVEVDEALSFLPRSELAAEVWARNGLRLCGAGISCPGGPPPR